ncbi:SMP-30/gluconolactonase/LRE family protein [Paractinoplanes lichenicola]|uniref:SMP-30/gluconolactonase/LRE family protein n=1 Tax=Paractinoplanes lichenicola TaxID=2802976 RepID=A0ABS1VMH0_9ACTN|nr:SMP-30/gluconolactonase/LRE family protein [Actinoplanes lichenicola]MBL7255844.1 SMP-30/gluconolactonase/LRE family protein [Actinoplanes lichenicola]
MPIPRPPAPWLIRPVKMPATTPPPLEGVWAPGDTRLDDIELLPLPDGHGPEDVVVGLDGRVYAGADDGRIWRWPADAHTDHRAEPIADTGGRPLGIEVDPRDGSLIVCDAYRGLLRLTPDGVITDLAHRVGGKRILLCNNAAVARDGTVYFTDSSNRFPVSHWRRDLLEHRPNGRVLAYDPVSGRVDVVAEGFCFPNGIALTPQEDALMLCETVAHQLVRITLNDGTVRVLDDLPAYPDNMSSVGDGTYWIALASPRVALAERLLPHPMLRRVAAVLPTRLQPQPLPHPIVAQVDVEGTVLRAFHGPAGRYVMATGVRQHGSTLWLGSLTEKAIARVALA